MSEQTQSGANDNGTEEQASEQQNQSDSDKQLETPGGEKALKEERAARRKAEKAMADLQKKVQEFEQRDMTEAQKLQAGYEEALAEAAQTKLELQRVRIGIKHNLSEEALEFLHGSTEEELDERAKKLAGMITVAAEERAKPDRKPDLSQGRGTGSSSAGDPIFEAMIDKIGLAKG